MKVKTSDLIGPALDWAVAKCEGRTIRNDPMGFGATENGGYWVWEEGAFWKIGRNYSPSTNWAHGGPIIEWEKFKLDPRKGQWEATIWNEAEMQNPAYGPTILIATMRCFCCSKLGDVVDIPEELCQQQSN